MVDNESFVSKKSGFDFNFDIEYSINK